MAHTPWREALDAKVRLIKYFRTNQFIDSHALIGLENSTYVHKIALYWQRELPNLEPVWIAPRIGTGLVNNLCDENTVFDMKHPSIPRKGLIWWNQPLTQVTLAPDNSLVNTIMRGIVYAIDCDPNGHTYMILCGWQQTATGFHPVIVNAIKDGENIEDWIIDRAIAYEKGTTPPPKAKKTLEALGYGPNSWENLDNVEAVRSMYGFLLRYVYTLFSFMAQRIVTHQPTPVDRGARREAERHAIHPEVRVITWRLKKYERLETEGKQIDWSCHWSSRAHDRHLKDGRVIPIPASIKGDLTKPYKPPTPNVHQVTRE